VNSGMPLFVPAGAREDGCTCPHCGIAVQLGESSAVCRNCGIVHHGDCWQRHGCCGSYTCAPARVEVGANQTATWKITAEEIGQAVPLPPRRPVSFSDRVSVPAVQQPRGNRLALAAFLTALAGIPFFGAVTGLVAILLGCLALPAQGSKQRGKGLAVTAILLGLVDVVGWVVFIAVMLQPGNALPVVVADFQRDPAALEEMPPHLNRAMRATVLITTPGKGFRGGAIGSGCILNLKDRKVLLVTNRHVVDLNFSGNANQAVNPEQLPPVEVHFVLGPAAEGTVVWLAPNGIDLALVRVEGDVSEARTAQWESNRPVHVGDQVFAIGSPHQLGWTHTQGAVSQLLRQHTGGPVVRVIQTQTPLNPGNSGGGLFDHEGFLVGINTWTNDKRVSEGLGFAISLATLAELDPPGLVKPHPDGVER
jgi:S1-C subfamily serine protease